ncbi:DHA2 family efflux MFS transporter permease subunit [Companilactobacillus keshanensis]|uniref:DHA2 family efflux MFS transporter permease subunit n=1 Tax=Companilactobacillus keshanensis TaxID=2486003 RepID=A0ABW4BUQ7_9LACO|nr:DHA2 family efflux MFS transporter permease subunit [Companilactobacillus keshanensis]
MNKGLNAKLILSIVATGLLSFSGVVVETATNVTFPTLMKEFNVTTSSVQWMTTGYLLVAAIMMPLSAFLKNRFTYKKLFAFAASLFASGLLIDVLAPAFLVLVIGRVVQGIGAGIALPLMFNIILEQAPRNKIGFLMGIGTLITAVAPAIGPTFGGVIVDAIGWRSIFGLLIPVIIIALIIGIYAIKQVQEPVKTHLDFLSVFYIALTFIGLIIGFSNLSKGLGMFLIPVILGIVFLMLFMKRSNQVEQPLLNLKVLKNKLFRQHLGAFFLFQMSALGMSFILPNYIQLVDHKSALMAGLVVLPGAAIGAMFAPVSGILLDNLGARRPIIFGSCLQILAMIIFAISGRSLIVWSILSFYILYMVGIGTSFGNTMTNGINKLQQSDSADGNGLFNTVQQFAGAVGTSIISAIVAISQSSVNSFSRAEKTAIGSQHGFIVLLVLLVIGALLLNNATKKED